MKISKIKRIKEYIEDVLDSRVGYYLITGILFGSMVVGGIWTLAIETKRETNKPPTYRDVNNDGIEDKIVRRKVDGVFFGIPSYTLEDEVFYGIEVNKEELTPGQKAIIYVPFDEYEKIMKVKEEK